MKDITNSTEAFKYRVNLNARRNNTRLYQERKAEIDQAIFNYEVFGGQDDGE